MVFNPLEVKNVMQILHKQESSRSDLENLLESLGIEANVMWAKDYPGHGKAILNIGDMIGTHWVATDGEHYFDPFGLAPDSDIPGYEKLEWVPIQIQSMKTGYCGQYCVLWLWYLSHKNFEEFYKLFLYTP